MPAVCLLPEHKDRVYTACCLPACCLPAYLTNCLPAHPTYPLYEVIQHMSYPMLALPHCTPHVRRLED